MSTHKYIDRICVAALILSLLISIVFINGESLGIQQAPVSFGYEDRLFDTSMVHTIDIVMDDWDSFIETCENEEYSACSVVIDGEAYKNVGIRAKGNTSLSSVSSMGSERYSFKIEFGQYDNTSSYYGLDKLCLNNIIQDNTYMKDYLTYQMMGEFGVNAPLCSFVYITVNNQDWGLYLAVEGVEDSFLARNYGTNYGELYKPDGMSMGGGRGNGKDFEMDDLENSDSDTDTNADTNTRENTRQQNREQNFQMMPEGMEMPDGTQQPMMPEGFEGGTAGEMPEDFAPSEMGGGMGSSDVKLQYIDDDPDSYSNIFGNAKTEITEADQTRLISSLKLLSEYENLEDVVNVEEVIRYFVVHNFVCNGDSYTGSMIHNYYLYEENGQLSMIPWDYNLAFGGFQASNATSTVNDPIDSPVSGGSSEDRPMVNWIFEDEAYTEMYHEYFAEFLETVNFVEIIEQTEELIASYVEKDPTKFCTYEEFELGVETLREFCELRMESVEGQLNGTIPSTSDGQNQDRTNLIDASDITISDMGSMGNGMGGGKDRDENNAGMKRPTMPEGMEQMPTVPEGMQKPDMSGRKAS